MKENNVFKQGRDAFRVAVKDFISLAQRLPGGLQMSQDLVIKRLRALTEFWLWKQTKK